VIQAEGAPIDQGRAQGRDMRREIEAGIGRLRRRYGPLAWLNARRRAQRTSGRVLARQLPQQSERLEGIAAAAGVPVAALTLAETRYRVQGVGFQRGAQLQATFEVPLELEPALALRESRPDAGGFPSVELTCAPFAGCLAGVNSEGIAAICLADRGHSAVSLRFLAQELIYRVRDLGAAMEHMRRRAAYLGTSGRLLVGNSAGDALWLEFDAGDVKVGEDSPEVLAIEPTVRIDAAACTLVWARTGLGDLEARAAA
jgi:hypothetical protein